MSCEPTPYARPVAPATTHDTGQNLLTCHKSTTRTEVGRVTSSSTLLPARAHPLAVPKPKSRGKSKCKNPKDQ